MGDDEIKRLIEQSTFSFIGTVEHMGAATMTGISIDPRTAVVRVEYVLHAPPALAHMQGQRATVQLLATVDPPAIGSSMAFFTEGLAFAESVALREIGRLPVQDVEPHANLAVEKGLNAGAFNEFLNDLKLDKLRGHSQSADAVVLGRIVGLHKATSVAPTRSEHDPDWWLATLDVRHVERGVLQPGPLEVLYANSLDTRWHVSPKPKAGQDGLWLLHKTPTDLQTAGAPFQIIHPEDYQPTHQLDAIRSTGRRTP